MQAKYGASVSQGHFLWWPPNLFGTIGSPVELKVIHCCTFICWMQRSCWEMDIGIVSLLTIYTW
jgi:hypothetical protein